MIKKLLLIFILLYISPIINAQWQAVGPYGGIVRCFDSIGSTVFIGTDGAGVLKSTNNGANWVGSSIGITNLEIYGLAHHGSTMLAGTYGDGVFKSTDNGANWTAITNGLTNTAINAVAMNGTTLFAGTTATNGGMFVSTDGGANWNLSNNGFSANIYILSITIDGNSVYAGTGDGVYVSTNNGTSWTAINNGLTDLYVNSVYANGSTLYAGTQSGLFKSSDGGASWSLLHASSLVTSIVVNGADIFTSWGTTTVGGVDVSHNNGLNWSTNYNGIASWIVGLSGSTLYAGTNGDGVFLSTDNGNNWTQSSVGINNINTPAVLLTNGTDIYAGAFLGGIFKTTNNGGSWSQMNNGLTNDAVQSLAADGSNIYAGTSGTGGGVFSSVNNGSNWSLVSSGITNNNVSAIAVNGTNLFAGTGGGGVFLSNNNGGSWTAVNNGLGTLTVQSLSVNNNNLYAGTFYGGVFKTTNNGGSWTQENNGLGNLNVNALASDSNKVFAGTLGGVYRTSDGGANWLNKNNGLTNHDVQSIACKGPFIFAGTNGGGVFFSCDTGNSWSAINEGLFSNAIKSIAISDTNVFAATHGGAIFRRSLSEILRAGVSIAITEGSNPTCSNESITFTATPLCGGCPASYQWKVNGNNVGGDSATYIGSGFTNGQIVTCVLTSNLQGIYNNPATSNGITISVTSAPATPSISQNGTMLTSSSSSGNQWYLDGAIINGATNQTYTINQNGNYTVIATVGSCTSDTSAVLTINNAFSAGVSIAQTAGTNPTCTGQSVTFTATPVNGGSTPSYLWLVNGQFAGTDSPTFTTTTLSSGDIVSCIMTSSMIGVNGNPATSNDLWLTVDTPPTAPTITANGVQLTSSSSTGNQWYLGGTIIPGATSQTYTATQNGVYTVIVTIGNCSSPASSGATISSFLNVSVLITLSSGSNPSCDGESLTFTATPSNGGSSPTYQWQVDGIDVNGATSSTYSTTSLTNNQSIACIVTSSLQNTTNNPASSNAIVMSINSTPSPTITQNGMLLSSSASSGNQWYLDGAIISGATSQTYTATQNGNYTVTATSNGCTSIQSTPVTINVAMVAGVTIIETNGSNPACEGDTITFTATPVNGGTIPAYQWQVNGNNVGTNSATYTTNTLANNDVVTCILFSSLQNVTGNPATSNTITMTVNPTPPIPSVSQNGTLLSSTAGSGNHWFFNGIPISDAFGSSYSAAQNGSYTVVVTVNGCSSTSAPYDVVNIGIAELENSEHFKIYPNPNDGHFSIEATVNNTGNLILEIRNALGQLVYNEAIQSFNGKLIKEFDVSNYTKGIYTLSIADGNKTHSKLRRIVVY